MYLDPERHRRAFRHGGDTAVLFVHGIQGSPCQFDFLTSALEDVIAYDKLILPGHGSDVRAFRRSGMEAWQNSVNEAAESLNRRYGRVYYVGHSMGCLLGLRSVLGGSARFDGMMLIACPLKLHFTLNYLKRNHLSLLVEDTSDPYMLAAKKANSVEAKSVLAYLSCLHPYLELIRLIRNTKSELAPVSCPISAFHAEGDEIVSVRSLDFLKDIGVETFVLPDSGHNYFSEESKEMMIRAMVQMMGI